MILFYGILFIKTGGKTHGFNREMKVPVSLAFLLLLLYNKKRVKTNIFLTQSNVIRHLSKDEYVDILNSVANIIRKSKQNYIFVGLCKGLLANPLRIRIA